MTIEAWVEQALSLVDATSWPQYRVALDVAGNNSHAVAEVLANNTPLVAVVRAADQPTAAMTIVAGEDRSYVIDELGVPVAGSLLVAIVAEAMLERYPGTMILFDIVCSRSVAETIAAHGGKPLRVAGDADSIKAAIDQYDAPFAGEHSGHFYFRDIAGADSGLAAALICLDRMSRSGKPLSELARSYRRYSNSGEITSKVHDIQQKLAELRSRYADGQANDIDGLTINYPTWWFNVRPNDKGKQLTLNVEASSDEVLKAKTEELMELIRRK